MNLARRIRSRTSLTRLHPAFHRRARAAFALGEISALGIHVDDLSPFVFDPASGPALLDQDVGNSDLERYPLTYCNDRFYLAIPTAVASAVTRFVVDSVRLLQIEP